MSEPPAVAVGHGPAGEPMIGAAAVLAGMGLHRLAIPRPIYRTA